MCKALGFISSRGKKEKLDVVAHDYNPRRKSGGMQFEASPNKKLVRPHLI
jgi:hypothetical protein